MKRLNLKTTAEASRKDSYTMPIDSINVYWEENPREDYGDEEFEQLKSLIRKDKEIHHPLFIMPDDREPGKWKLSHGFRRHRCVIELREEGIMIEQVPVKQIYSEEEALLLHITLNNSTKALTDVELAKTIREYSKLTQNDSVKFLSEKTGLPIHKVRTLIEFDETAGTVLKKAVMDDEVSFTTAVQIAANSTGIEHQNTIISEGKKEAEKQGKKRITNTIVDIQIGRVKINKELDKLRSALCMNGNYSEVVRVIDNIGMEMSELLSILKQEAGNEA